LENAVRFSHTRRLRLARLEKDRLKGNLQARLRAGLEAAGVDAIPVIFP
jgi:hypothetical protein